ncbi:molybdopterin-dependent oxidoreductase [Tissierella sp. MB52-C2]|uniref:xanthine dehydrogenase family protein molybdopterin-binding subunit n=1 Tax=Tissierella sp. MB52-C2 TaxID=3070999 RepID=UPI00280AD322|nr:molybdopterin cofactor-binding domain-containing protein [Tissierella sp. MB52-C2]WMM25047.1 molybdopterin-dependent oxidoreductase [Tissierella sp. MB52-C2]
MIGKGIRKTDSEALLGGKPVYTDDLVFHRDVLIVKILRSPHAFARIKNINVDIAKKVPGVVDIYTYKDVPQTRYSECGESLPEASPYDRLILEEIVRYVGDEVAIIVAEDEKTAEKAKKLIKVEYEVFEPILDPEKAENSTIRIHEDDSIISPFDFGYNNKKNIVSEFNYGHGDVEEEFKNCEVIIERTYQTQAQAHCMMETLRAYSYLDERGRMNIISANQSVYHMRRQTAKAIGLPISKVRVIKPRIGGGFGGKNVAITEPFVAFATLKTGRPCKLILSRKETFSATSVRHPIKVSVKIASDKEGNIKAIYMKALNNTGAYGSNGPAVTMEVGQNSLPLYAKVPAIKFEGKTVYTNMVPSGPLRGYGATQGSFAMDSAINELAIELGMDPIELKLKNTIRKGAVGGIIPQSIKSFNIEKCIERGKELIDWDEKYPRKEISPNKVRGIGMATAIHSSGISGIDAASVLMRLEEDGTYRLFTASSDLGTGSDTILCQIAAHALNTDMDGVNIHVGDTDACPYDTGAYASSTTYVTGNAVVRAAEKLKLKIIDKASKKLNMPSIDLVLEKDRVRHKEDESMFILLRTIGEEAVVGQDAEVLMADATYGTDYTPRPFLAGFAEVEVDTFTGQVELVNYVVAADCGTVINPTLAKIQLEGGLTQGIGLAMFEDVKYTKEGKLITDSFLQYNVPTKKDIGNITVEFQSDYEPTGPFGAKSIAESAVHTPPPAIANAIYNAVGVYIRDLPITSEKVYKGMKELRGQKS